MSEYSGECYVSIKHYRAKRFSFPKLLTLILFFIQIFTQSTAGQSFTLEGKITDAKSGSPIQGATVFISPQSIWLIQIVMAIIFCNDLQSSTYQH